MAEETVVFEVDLDAQRVATELAKIQKASSDLRLERKALDLQLKTNQITEQEYTQAIAQNTIATQRLSKQRQDNTRQLKAIQQATDSATGSLKQQQAVLRLLQNEFDNLSDREGKNADRAAELRKRIDSLNETVLNAEKSTGRAQRQVGFYEKALQSAGSRVNLFGTNLGSLITDLKDFREAITAQAAATKASTAATSGATNGLKLFRLALIGTGIGALIVALGVLIQALSGMQKVQDAVTRGLTIIRTAFDRVIGSVQNVIVAVRDSENVFQDLLDFLQGQVQNRVNAAINIFIRLGDVFTAVAKGNIGDLNDAIVDIGKEMVDFQTGVVGTVDIIQKWGNETLKVGNRLDDLRQQLVLVKRENTTLIESLRAQAEEQRTLAQNVTLTDAERTKAAKNALDLLQQIETAQLREIDLEIERLELLLDQNDTLDDEKQKLAELQAERDKVVRERISQQREVNNQLNSLVQERIKSETDALQVLEELREKNALSQIDNEREKQERILANELEAQKKSIKMLEVAEGVKRAILLELEQQYQIQLQALRDQYRDIESESDATFKQQQIEREMQRLMALRELDVLEAENLQERNKALLALQAEQQEQELQQFKGTEEQRLLLQAQFTADQIALKNQLRDAEIAANLAIAQSANKLFSSLAGLARENAGLQKAAALFDIGVSTATAIAQSVANATQSAAATGPAAVFTQPGFVLQLVGQVTAAIAQARKVLQNTPSFAKGGALEFPADTGGVIRGPSHARGGVPFSLGGIPMEAEGGELIVNKRIWTRPDFVSAISEMNYLTGGRRFESGGIVKFQDGGIATSLRQGTNVTQEVIKAIQSTPVIVTVEDINAGQARQAQVVNRANL